MEIELTNICVSKKGVPSLDHFSQTAASGQFPSCLLFLVQLGYLRCPTTTLQNSHLHLVPKVPSTEKCKRPTWGYLHHRSRQTFSKVQHERAGEVRRALKSFQWRVGRRRSGEEESRGQENQLASVGVRPLSLDSAYPPCKEGVDSWWWTGGVRRWQGPGFDSSGSHVGQELVWNFGKHFFGQTSHAQDVVSSPINVVSERNELRRGNEKNRRAETRRGIKKQGYA